MGREEDRRALITLHEVVRLPEQLFIRVAGARVRSDRGCVTPIDRVAGLYPV